MAYRSRRGGFAPRSTRDRPHGGFPYQKRDEPTLDIEKYPLGELLLTFQSNDFDSKTEDSLDEVIQDCTHIASYNWVSRGLPTIMIPGKPPKWTPSTTPQRLQEDNGSYFRDPNAAHFPLYPMLPSVHAILDHNPVFPTPSIDVFACGYTLGNLLRFVRFIDKPFRFTFQTIGNTVFFVRKENDPRELLQGVRGYGHTFPEASTTWESSVKGSESHQRLVQYNLAGLQCIVRFECDGYIASESTSSSPRTKQTTGLDIDNLVNELAATSTTTVRQNSNHSNPKEELSLTVEHNNQSTPPPEHIFDLKTRSNKHGKQIDMQDMYPILWLKQIPYFIIAYHDGHGGFSPATTHVMNVVDALKTWEKANREAILRFRTLLGRIVEVGRQADGEILEVVCFGKGQLEIRGVSGERKTEAVLPEDVAAKWASVDVEDGDDGSESEKEEEDDYDQGGGFSFADEDEWDDYTACGEDCGYCGKCTY
ncbi:unnamed protein product [Periconia digitata]|uniref:Uncharacterized protein n=1 Tax=Periconia digitata TaxID=1303443 RepID=A0A9W4USW8_9PLEO|nr:unnamed protein product [Periconia digitata]